jgi:hypothetical protein
MSDCIQCRELDGEPGKCLRDSCKVCCYCGREIPGSTEEDTSGNDVGRRVSTHERFVKHTEAMAASLLSIASEAPEEMTTFERDCLGRCLSLLGRDDEIPTFGGQGAEWKDAR